MNTRGFHLRIFLFHLKRPKSPSTYPSLQLTKGGHLCNFLSNKHYKTTLSYPKWASFFLSHFHLFSLLFYCPSNSLISRQEFPPFLSLETLDLRFYYKKKENSLQVPAIIFSKGFFYRIDLSSLYKERYRSLISLQRKVSLSL